jgi:hypothetical protein
VSRRWRGRSPQPVDAAQDLGEQRPRHNDFGQLEDDVAPVPDDPGADLHQLVAQRRERPVLDLLRQGQRPQEVGQVVALATPEPIKDWSLTSLKGKLIKIGAKVVSHGCCVAFQMAEVAVPRALFAKILRLIAELRPRSPLIPA